MYTTANGHRHDCSASLATTALVIVTGIVTLLVGAGAAHAADLEAVSLEITQGIQDSGTTAVRLVRNRPTYVRFHVAADEDVPGVTATLKISPRFGGSGKEHVVRPINPGGTTITVTTSPDRGRLEDSFLFEVPAELTTGFVDFTATVNPYGKISDSNGWNDVVAVSKFFFEVPTMKLKLYKVSYSTAAGTVTPGRVDTDGLSSWLRRAYPIPDLDVEVRTLDFEAFPSDCDEVNARLSVVRLFDFLTGISFDGWVPTLTSPGDTRYYGMVHDNDDPSDYFMRGCAMDIPTHVASGPTGDGMWSWDTDGTYGDWYGAHELGHAYGRCHAEFCGATGGCSDQTYPYADGMLSDAELYGFDAGDGSTDPAILSPDTWTDVMTYCDNEWLSDFTFEGILDRMTDEATASGSSGGSSGAGSSTPVAILLARVDFDRGTASFDDVYTTSTDRELPPVEPGEYEIRMLDRHGSIVSSHMVEAHVAVHEEGAVPPGVDLAPPANVATIAAMLPLDPTCSDLVLVHQGRELARRRASANPPTVRMVHPNGGESFGKQVTVRWASSDPDGSPLSATLQISGDDGQHWSTVDTRIRGGSYRVKLAEWPASEAARFRVLLSDGFHTVEDESDGPFSFGANRR